MGISGEKWGIVGKSGHKWHKWPGVAICGFMWLNTWLQLFYVAKSGEKWFYVVQSMYYLQDNT